MIGTLKAKLKRNMMTPNESYYLHCWLHKPIVKDTVLVECSHGREFSGHLYYLVKELCEDYPHMRIQVALRNPAAITLSFPQVEIVKHMSRNYLYSLATSEYLWNDTSFWSFFHKRPEQHYAIFWHGTPLKKMGKEAELQGYGNVQRNFSAADQLFVSNHYTADILARDFGIADITDTKIVIGPSPRNTGLFMHEPIVGRYAYMPTWRGENAGYIKKLIRHLHELDESLMADEELYIKLHPYEAELVDFEKEQFERIKQFPKEMELYEFLSTVSVLITDYSSVFFDYLNTNQKIILFPFDKSDYSQKRGLYQSIECLPLTQVETVSNLLTELRSPNNGVIEQKALHASYVSLDNHKGAKEIIHYLFRGVSDGVTEIDLSNHKMNILIYAYQLDDNGITSSLFNVLERADKSKHNYILTWQEGMIPKRLEYKLRQLPEGVYTFMAHGKTQSTYQEMFETVKYAKGLPAKKKNIEEMYQRDFFRQYLGLNIHYFVHYPGYDRSYAMWMWALKPIGVKTVIVVHTDIEEEMKLNRTLNLKLLCDAYAAATHVVTVTATIERKINVLCPSANTVVMNVLFSEATIYKRANETVLDRIHNHRLQADLSNEQLKIFLNIGRFSKQKGLDRLIIAFNQLTDDNVRLLICATYGPMKDDIVSLAKNSRRANDIYIINYLSNPLPLMNYADAFVFSSRYEGLGMVVFEALALNTPVIMTRIPETLEALGGEDYTLVVENSTKGLVNGMEEYLKHPAREVRKINLENRDSEAIKIWDSLFL